MRLWSIHPSYLDTKGLLAVWREGLLALHVLRGQTKGYTHHPQLFRFQQHRDPIAAVSAYLHVVVDEAENRGYEFKREKLSKRQIVPSIEVTSGQVVYETEHLLRKLEQRDLQKFLDLQSVQQFKTHPLFTVIPGEIESWEKVMSNVL